jgi:hypothetical protein
MATGDPGFGSVRGGRLETRFRPFSGSAAGTTSGGRIRTTVELSGSDTPRVDPEAVAGSGTVGALPRSITRETGRSTPTLAARAEAASVGSTNAAVAGVG